MPANGRRVVRSERTDEIYTAICASPGMTAWQLSKRTGIDYRALYSSLATLERLGYLLYEDDYGNLYPYQESE